MFSLQITVVFTSVILFYIYPISDGKPIEDADEDKKDENNEEVLQPDEENVKIGAVLDALLDINKPLSRVKRSSASKFTEASRMSQLKLLRLYLQMARNAVTGNDIGGIHPLAHNVPKPTVLLIKSWIFDFLFPNVGQKKTVE